MGTCIHTQSIPAQLISSHTFHGTIQCIFATVSQRPPFYLFVQPASSALSAFLHRSSYKYITFYSPYIQSSFISAYHMRRFNHISASVDRITIEVGNSSSPLPSADVYWLDGFEPSGEYTDNRAVFIEARPRQIRCVSEGGFPLPEMRLYVGEREVTKMFSQSNSVTLDGERGLRQIHYRIERSTSYLSFSALDDEQPIRCVVTVSGFPANQTHLIVNVIRKQTCYLLIHYCTMCVGG